MSSDNNNQFFNYLKTHCNYTVVVPAGNGNWVGLQRLLYHWTMHMGKIGDLNGYDRRYCYATFDLATDALAEWATREFDGDPIYWHRDPITGRRRPDGDPKKEYIEP
jgi:hypothetical protein